MIYISYNLTYLGSLPSDYSENLCFAITNYKAGDFLKLLYNYKTGGQDMDKTKETNAFIEEKADSGNSCPKANIVNA